MPCAKKGLGTTSIWIEEDNVLRSMRKKKEGKRFESPISNQMRTNFWWRRGKESGVPQFCQGTSGGGRLLSKDIANFEKKKRKNITIKNYDQETHRGAEATKELSIKGGTVVAPAHHRELILFLTGEGLWCPERKRG